MPAEAAATLMTVEEFLALPPDDAVERWLIDGELRERPTMGYRNRYHSECMGLFAHALNAWRAETKRPGKVLVGDAGFRIPGDPPTLFGIDVAFVNADVLAATPANSTIVHGVPVLAVEILSPSDTYEYVNDKLARLLGAGTPLVWIADTFNRTVTAYRPGAEPRLYTASQDLEAEPILPGFRAAVATLFG